MTQVIALAALQHTIAIRVQRDAPSSFSVALEAVRDRFEARSGEEVGPTAADVLEVSQEIYEDAVAEIRSLEPPQN